MIIKHTQCRSTSSLFAEAQFGAKWDIKKRWSVCTEKGTTSHHACTIYAASGDKLVVWIRCGRDLDPDAFASFKQCRT